MSEIQLLLPATTFIYSLLFLFVWRRRRNQNQLLTRVAVIPVSDVSHPKWVNRGR